MENGQMTTDEVIVWLHYVRDITHAINEIERKYRRAQLKAHNVKHRSTLTGYGTVIEVLEKERKQATLERQGLISRIEDVTYRKLLTSRYILCKSWRDVAEDISYDYDYTYSTLHRRAIAAAAECTNRYTATPLI